MKTEPRKVGPACRAGLSSNARTVSERTSIQHRRVASRSTSLNRRSRHAAKSSSASSSLPTFFEGGVIATEGED
jgi:hypothetical protein